ncbi:MAG TPA: CPBP family glutamic-type intramembrane protease [Urbifossiella sp.]
MPADLWNEAMRMAGCGVAVGMAAAPFGLAGWLMSRRLREPVLPSPSKVRVPWTGFEVVVAFLMLNMVVPGITSAALAQSPFFQWIYGPEFPVATEAAPSFEAEAAAAGTPVSVAAHETKEERIAVRTLWTGLIALPFQVGLLILIGRISFPAWRLPAKLRTAPTSITIAILAWAVLTPIVLLIHSVVNLLFAYLNIMPESHPLSKLSASQSHLDQFLFLAQAGLATPFIEEIMFRGLLLGWLFGGRSLFDRESRSLSPPASGRRIWIVLGISAAMARLTSGPHSLGPVLFAAVLIVGWALLNRKMRSKRRTVGAIYASAAFFAVVHSGVWPTPIPLFILGLGLGWLALRTRGILAPTIVHGLFNTVSVVFVLRG